MQNIDISAIFAFLGVSGQKLKLFGDRHLPEGQECGCAHHRFRTQNDASPDPQPPSNTLYPRTPALCTIHHPSRLLVGGRLREIGFEQGCHLGLHRGLRETTRKGLVEIFCGDAATRSTPPRPVVTVGGLVDRKQTLGVVCEL